MTGSTVPRHLCVDGIDPAHLSTRTTPCRTSHSGMRSEPDHRAPLRLANATRQYNSSPERVPNESSVSMLKQSRCGHQLLAQQARRPALRIRTQTTSQTACPERPLAASATPQKAERDQLLSLLTPYWVPEPSSIKPPPPIITGCTT